MLRLLLCLVIFLSIQSSFGRSFGAQLEAQNNEPKICATNGKVFYSYSL